VKTVGIAVIGGSGGGEVRNCKLTGNRTAVDINNSSGNYVHNCVIDFNRTGIVLRNACPNNRIEENYVTNNWTLGILWLAFSTETATGTTFSNNNIDGNWYAQIENRSLTGGVKNFSANWLGTTAPVTYNTNSSEPAYADQIPVQYGGTATPPGNPATARGAGIDIMDFTPWLGVGTDTNMDNGTGTVGFQGSFATLFVDDGYGQYGQRDVSRKR